MRRRRTLFDDLKWAVAVLAGMLLATLLFDADPAILIGAVAAAGLMIATRATLRRAR